MKDKLEVFIKNNKHDFDTEQIPNGIWGKIESRLDQAPKEKNRFRMLFFKVAAIVVVVLGMLLVLNYQSNKNTITFEELNPEYAVKQANFAGLIIEKRDSLAILSSTDPNLYKQFTEDLKKLDHEYERLESELVTSPNQQLVLKAMVKNRELQLQILKQQLFIFNEVIDNKLTQI